MSDNSPPPTPEQPQPEPPVAAPPPSLWAPPAPPPRRQRTGLIVTLAVGGSLVVAGALVALVHSLLDAAADSIALPPARSAPYEEEAPDDEEGPYDEETEPVAPGPRADGDATVTKCVRDKLIGWPHAEVEVVNRGDGPAGYIVFVEFVDPDGKMRTGGVAIADDLAPGASVKAEAQGLGEVPAGTTCRIDRVERDPA
ncbi:hypothetical protein ACIQIG_05770 [Streptomyces bacillaris]|uniref:hypothetical protein n=1 Tax=Streptomyces bacillaris TaxID=68179 RepID=UPI003460866D